MNKLIQIKRHFEVSVAYRSNLMIVRNFLLLIIFIAVPLLTFSQTDTVAHLYTFGGNNNDNAEEIEATTDGGYIVVGSTSSNSAGNTDVYLLKVDSLCNYQWSYALGGSNNDWGYSVKQTFDKGFIIAASSNSYGNGGYDAVLMKRDSMGNYQWIKSYGGQDWDFAYSVVQTHDSGYVFCGETYNNTNGYSDVYIVKTNPLGDTLWTKTIGGTLIDKGNSVIETSDSNIVVAGIRNTTTDSTQAYVIKLSFNGILLWDSIYGDTLYEVVNSVIETSDGGYVLTGAITNSSLANDLDYYVSKTDGNGVKIWEQIFSGIGNEMGYDALELANNNLFIVGYTEATGSGGKDTKLFLITSGGWWGGANSSFGGVLDESIKSITMGNNGSMKLAGFSNGYGNGLDDALIISIDTVTQNQQFTVDTILDLAPLLTTTHSKDIKLLIYPNPTSGKISFDTNIQIDNIELIDIYGRRIKKLKINSNNQLNVSDVSNGIYNIVFFSKQQLINTQKITIIR